MTLLGSHGLNSMPLGGIYWSVKTLFLPPKVFQPKAHYYNPTSNDYKDYRRRAFPFTGL